MLLAGLPSAEAEARLAAAPPARLTPCTETDPSRLLGILAQVRREHGCLVDQELRLGLRSLGVAIADRAGVVRIGLSL